MGRESVFQFDQQISVAMEINATVAPWTHGENMTPLQKAASELIPHGFSIALSIRELVRQGYLVSAEILLRPLVERAAVISYLCDTPNALSLWENGWPYKSRPPLYKMLAVMRGMKGEMQENEQLAKQITQHFNALVHADPLGARKQITKLGDGSGGYTASKSLNDAERCDDVCFQAAMYLIVLISRAAQIFPEAIDEQY